MGDFGGRGGRMGMGGGMRGGRGGRGVMGGGMGGGGGRFGGYVHFVTSGESAHCEEPR